MPVLWIMGRACPMVRYDDVRTDSIVFTLWTWWGDEGCEQVVGNGVFIKSVGGENLVLEMVQRRFEEYVAGWNGLGEYLVGLLDTGEAEA